MAHIFISYAHSNREYARKLADHLLASGFDVWIDDRIDFGTNWVREIFKAIDASAAFILIMSPEADASDWVQKEYLQADAQKKPMLPLLLDGGVFPYLRNVQYYDVRDGEMPQPNFIRRLATFTVQKESTGQDVATVPQQTAEKQAQSLTRRGLGVVGGAALIVALAVVIFLVVNTHNNNPTPSATVAQGITNTPGQVALAPSYTATFDPLTQVWLDFTRTAQVWTSTPSATFTATNTDTATLDNAATYAQVQHNAAATLTAIALTPTNTPKVTPNGGGRGQIAFYTNRDGNYEIYVMNADGSDPRRLTNNAAMDMNPAWSPDGLQIAFDSKQDGNAEIYAMNADGSNPYKLSDNPAFNAYPAWSLDGTQIAFQSYRDENYEIYIMNADGSSNPRNLSNNSAADYIPAWSPDGTQIAFYSERDGNLEIYVMNADGSNPHRLTNNLATDFTPAWSPDGTQIAFSSDRDGNDEIYVMNADGSNLRRLTNSPAHNDSPAWSPDGTQIAFISQQSNGYYEIYAMNADGSNPHNISNDPVADDEYPKWRP
ncbi:MAG: TIR domain-containing protein [Chloroflexota bacterium]